MNICPLASSSNVTVRIAISSLLGVKLADKVQGGEVISFDVKARMEEKERRSSRVVVSFALTVGTRPSVAKFEVEGIVTLEGKDADIDKMLEVDPETQIPFVFQRVYQYVFMSIYLLSTLIDAPHPPPNLLFSNQQQMPMVQMSESATASREEKKQTGEVLTVPEEKTTVQPGSTTTTPQEETTVPETEQTVETATEIQENKKTPERESLFPEA